MNILVSSCLLGINCKYTGGNNKQADILKLIDKCILIPVCPEQFGGLSTPRDAVELVNNRAITDKGVDLTEYFEKGAYEVLELAKIYNCKYAILKQRSPSCGNDYAYDGTFSKKLIEGKGITTRLLELNDIKVYNETQLEEIQKII